MLERAGLKTIVKGQLGRFAVSLDLDSDKFVRADQAGAFGFELSANCRIAACLSGQLFGLFEFSFVLFRGILSQNLHRAAFGQTFCIRQPETDNFTL